MNCQTVQLSLSMYLTHELSPAEMRAFEAHLLACSDCAALEAQSRAIDAMVRRAVEENAPAYSEGLDRRIRKALRPAPAVFSRRFTVALAAAACILIVLALGMPAWLNANYRQAAAEDFRREIIEGQPRLWATNTADIQKVSNRLLPDPRLIASVTPAGFRLEKAKICSLKGKEFVHLVFTRGSEQISMHIAPATGWARIRFSSKDGVNAGVNVASVKASDYLILVEALRLDPGGIAGLAAKSAL